MIEMRPSELEPEFSGLLERFKNFGGVLDFVVLETAQPSLSMRITVPPHWQGWSRSIGDLRSLLFEGHHRNSPSSGSFVCIGMNPDYEANESAWRSSGVPMMCSLEIKSGLYRPSTAIRQRSFTRLTASVGRPVSKRSCSRGSTDIFLALIQSERRSVPGQRIGRTTLTQATSGGVPSTGPSARLTQTGLR